MISWIFDVGPIDPSFTNLVCVMRAMGPIPSFLLHGCLPSQ